MERSPRSAGVRPRTAIMGQYHTLRSFVISLAIAIAINKSPASGFTVARDILDLMPDLETEESKQLEVKYDLKTLNNNETIYNNKTGEDSDSTVIAIDTLQNNNKQNYSYENSNEIQPIVNETTDTTTMISETDSNIYTTSAPSEIQTTTPEPVTTQDLSTVTSVQTLFTTGSETDNFKEYSTVTGVTEDQNNMRNITSTATPYTNNMTDITSTAIPNTKNTSNNVNTNDADESKNKTNDFNNSIQNAAPEFKYTSAVFITTIADSETTTETGTGQPEPISDRTTIIEETTIAKTDGSLGGITTEVTTVNNTEVVTTDLYPITLPPWKKYTTIDRKHISTSTSAGPSVHTPTTTTEKDMARAETAQTRISLEKMFTNTPRIETNVNNATDSETITTPSKIDTETKTETTKLEIVSKRAGFIDNRDTTTTNPEGAVRAELQPKVSTNTTEMYSTEYETEAGEVEGASNKNVSIYESQSQLAEDAIKEELLKEEMLNDNEDIAKFKHMKQGKMGYELGGDMLSVKPIGQDKKKHTILYAVSPNYRPLKKIDVQPPKQFVRDPDDNSWRNESISSLGIVFKPKNASKSFTQVLKNKTETELGNVTDKESKGDLPDLRDRLEKIAEVRKSKKNINKFGDTVYGDYEESSENPNPFREDNAMTTPMSSTVESIFTSTPPPPSQTSKKESDVTAKDISKEHFDIFKNEKTVPITTIKPKKLYNLAEYYDASDEYDTDYVNQHKIDLKKFTKPIKDNFATQPPELLRTQPMREYQPMRMATLQYFPPTQKIVEKVNMNDYDTNFNRKVNLYNFNKAPPKNVITASFGTVSPIPTEDNEPLNKVTMKPAYTPMYQTDNLDKNLYLTNQPGISEPPPGGLVTNDGNFNRASYVIKHYRDFINEAAKGGEDETSDYPFTDSPVHGVTVNDLAKMNPREGNQGEDDYEYDAKFRKDIMNRFVDNFNQNSERFKVTFPILYNSTVVHRQTPEHGRVASSSAFMKRLYEVGSPRSPNFLRKMCDPHCDKTVELSPAYELHYYVPDEEEKEEMQPRAMTASYRYRL